MDRGAAAAQGTAPPQDGEQPAESPEPPPPWPPPQPPPPQAPPLLHAPSPEPAPQFCPEPAPEPCPEATPKPATELDTEPIPEPDTQPAPAPSPEPATELNTKLISEPAKKPASKPAPEPAPEPATEPAPEPATKPASEPTPVPAIEPAPEPAPEPATEPATESCREPAPESCPEPSPALGLLQRPVVAPERSLGTSSSPRTPVLLSSIKKILKEGPLLKNCNSFKRWKLRYFLVRGQRLCFAHHPAFARFETIDLSQVALAESSCRNLYHSFCVITPQRKVTLAAPNRKDMEEWINVIKTVQQGEIRKVHDDCRRRFSKECCFGSHRTSVIPPTALSDPKGDGQLVVSSDFWSLDWSSACSCPLLIFINSKSGDHQGIVFLRKFKQYLNPSQVFDLSKGGPEAGLCMFKNFARFRIVVCGGDGSVSWVLSLIDAFGLHERCQLAVIPLGTGNDLARVLGWGAFWNKNKSPLNILSRVEQASVRILDRWSVMIRETPRQTPLLRGQVEMDVPRFEAAAIQHLESATIELDKILKAKYPTEMIIATRFLCSAVEDFVVDIVKAWSQIKQNNTAIESVILKSDLMYDKLSVLIDVLADEAAVEKSATGSADSGKADGEPFIPQIDHIAKCKLELATKAQNLQKSLKLIIFQVEQVLDEQSRQTISVKNFTSTLFLESDSEDTNQTSPKHGSRCGTMTSISSLKREDLDNLNLEHLHFTPETIRFKERCVMNNYFGIGLDAKISLEFNTRRDEHPGQYNSRIKNKMWYGLLGSKELFHRSYRKLEERVRLECDGEAISLPNLQGIVVLNITSYAGGVNFWGSSTATTEYEAPAIDDGKLEVVAIFGSVQMAMSRIINLHHHRIAQCREVMITIDGEEGIPVQVDGEAWVQRPGLIKIRYKNVAQMLTRDRDFENSMKMWEYKHTEIQAASQPQLDSKESQYSLSDEEYAQMQHLAQLAENLISRLTDLSKVHQHVSVLMDSVNASANILNDIFHSQDSGNEAGAASCTPIETLNRNDAVDVTFSLKGLYDDTKAFLDENLLRNAEDEATLQTALDAMNKEFEKLSKIDWMSSILVPEEKSSDTDSRKLKVKFPKLGKKKLEKEDKPKSGQRVRSFIGNLWHRRNREDEAKDDEPPMSSRSQL
nr:diacylglycerol kinase kappa [Equus asinus]